MRRPSIPTETLDRVDELLREFGESPHDHDSFAAKVETVCDELDSYRRAERQAEKQEAISDLLGKSVDLKSTDTTDTAEDDLPSEDSEPTFPR